MSVPFKYTVVICTNPHRDIAVLPAMHMMVFKVSISGTLITDYPAVLIAFQAFETPFSAIALYIWTEMRLLSNPLEPIRGCVRHKR